IQDLLIDIERELRAAFSSEMYEKNKMALLQQFRTQVEELWKRTDAFALERNFKIERTTAGINTIPLRFGRPMERQEYENLSQGEKDIIAEREKEVEQKIRETVHQMGKINEQLRKALDEFMEKTAANAVKGLFEPLKEYYKDFPKVLDYLDAYLNDVIE